MAPTMKTLDQVEARIIVNAANTPGDATNTFIISQPGSYNFSTPGVPGDWYSAAEKTVFRLSRRDTVLVELHQQRGIYL